MQQPDWQIDTQPIPYPDAISAMEARVAAVADGQAQELVWLLEHPAIYTAGTSANPQDLINPRLPIHQTGRGGQITYHGPGQRIAYVILDLRQRSHDVRRHVRNLEQWGKAALAQFGIEASTREGRVGLWVGYQNGREDKIIAIGVRVRRWIAYHGIALNVNPDLSYFQDIVPCGIKNDLYGVTSMAALGKSASVADVDAALRLSFDTVFNLP
ncbi:MAG: lipoyl(octanoyl) transferase LipB [Alphaproteobacteria bacterium]